MIHEPHRDTDTRARPGVSGAEPYSRRFLSGYDSGVIRFALPRIWGCAPADLVDLHVRHVGRRHLDVGVGTGYFLDEAGLAPRAHELVLFDLNANALECTSERLARFGPTAVRGNVLEPIAPVLAEAGAPGPFDSASMTLLLHCLPGSMADKGIGALTHVAATLKPGGVAFGATVLGRLDRYPLRSRIILRLANLRGIFHNLDDDLEGLDAALGQVFDSHRIVVRGRVALFVGRVAAKHETGPTSTTQPGE